MTEKEDGNPCIIKNDRTAEILAGGKWERWSFEKLKTGDIFRLFDDTGEPVDHGEICRAVGLPHLIDALNGDPHKVWAIQCEPAGRREHKKSA